jgi:hypothetical protein
MDEEMQKLIKETKKLNKSLSREKLQVNQT